MGTMKEGVLAIVSTPIGNLEDMTFRAVRVLQEVDYILCEDTRVTGKLLKHYGIETKMRRYDAHTSEQSHTDILADLEDGKHIALVSDAGTPCVSDPGVLLVARAREAGVCIYAVPGASALITAFSLAGITGNHFLFLGFAPHKKGRQTFFKEIAESAYPVIFYEAPHRLMKSLESLRDVCTDESRVYVARELTKMFEEVIDGTPAEVLTFFTQNADHVRGECVIMVVP